MRIAEAIRTEDPDSAYQARLAQIQEGGLGGVGSGGAGDNTAAPRLVPVGGSSAPWLQPLVGGGQRKPNNDIGQFAGTGQPDRWRLNSTAEPPRTPYELRAGFVIPATMISGINSELPGQIMAQVSQGVYDTPTGKHLLAWFKSCRFWVTLFPDFKMPDPVKPKAWALWRSFESVTLD